ncbi:MAG: sigma-70 family RNA polymerase sigma factor [Trebonia sp.]
MNDDNVLAARFEEARPRLRAVAYRMLGSLDDADDAVQAAWLKASRAGVSDVRELGAWFTTVTVRQCLDQLRARRRRAEVLLPDDQAMSAFAPAVTAADEELLRAESVGRALLVVLGRLSPGQRAAFVLHDLLAMPFDEIGPMLDRSPVAAKKLASRARQRLQGKPPEDQQLTAEHFKIAEAFLSASRRGDIAALLELLAADVVRKADRVLIPGHAPTEMRGARKVAEGTKMFAAWARAGDVVLIDGTPGIIIAPAGRLKAVIRLSMHSGSITAIEVMGDPGRLAATTITLQAAGGRAPAVRRPLAGGGV